jgi:hypothetical protein
MAFRNRKVIFFVFVTYVTKIQIQMELIWELDWIGTTRFETVLKKHFEALKTQKHLA